MTKTATATDFLGKTINVGDTIVYPGRRGSSLWLNWGVVREIVDREGYGGELSVLRVGRRIIRPGYTGNYGKDGTVVTVTELDRVAVVTAGTSA